MTTQAEVIRGKNAIVAMRLTEGHSGVDHLAGELMARAAAVDLGDSDPAEARKLVGRAIPRTTHGHSSPRIDVYAFEPYDAGLLISLAGRGECSESSADVLRKEYGGLVARRLAEKAGKVYRITDLGRDVAAILAD